MTIEQIVVLSVVQGITEFLPISSSGHLILIPQLMHWPDQGILVDVMTHFGTLLAILIYFWRDVWHLILGGLTLLRGKLTDDGRLALYIVLATIPAVVFGFMLKKFGYTDLERNVAIVAWKIFANYFNHVAGTEVDFPEVEATGNLQPSPVV